MKSLLAGLLGVAGLVYGLSAVLMVYPQAPLTLQLFIVAAVTTCGAAVGLLLGLLANWALGKSAQSPESQ